MISTITVRRADGTEEPIEVGFRFLFGTNMQKVDFLQPLALASGDSLELKCFSIIRIEDKDDSSDRP